MFNLTLTYDEIELLLAYALFNAVKLGTTFIDVSLFQKVLSSRYFTQNLLKHFRKYDQNLICQFDIDSFQKVKLLPIGNSPSLPVNLHYAPGILRKIESLINKIIIISLPRQKLLQLNFSREHQSKVRHKKKLYQEISLRYDHIT
jgi:hypothetical protein